MDRYDVKVFYMSEGHEYWSEGQVRAKSAASAVTSFCRGVLGRLRGTYPDVSIHRVEATKVHGGI